MLRTIFFYTVLVPSTLFFSLLAIFFGLFKAKRTIGWVGRTWSRSLVWAAGLRLHVDLGALPPDQQILVVSNHQSQWDIPLLYVALSERTLNFVAKESLFRVPFFGKAMLAAGHVPIDRSNRRKSMQSIDLAVESATSERTVVIFPEGTRAHDLSSLQEFKIGGIIIALKTGLPVAPVIISGSGRVLPAGRMMLTPGVRDVYIKALPPIDVSGYSLKDRERFKEELHTTMNASYQEQPQ